MSNAEKPMNGRIWYPHSYSNVVANPSTTHAEGLAERPPVVREVCCDSERLLRLGAPSYQRRALIRKPLVVYTVSTCVHCVLGA